LLYLDLKVSFKYEIILQIKEKMEKAISDLIENNTQSDQNEYYSKVVQVCYI
jgi:hypothetical protein